MHFLSGLSVQGFTLLLSVCWYANRYTGFPCAVFPFADRAFVLPSFRHVNQSSFSSISLNFSANSFVLEFGIALLFLRFDSFLTSAKEGTAAKRQDFFISSTISCISSRSLKRINAETTFSVFSSSLPDSLENRLLYFVDNSTYSANV